MEDALVSYFVSYKGHALDADAFVRAYRERHARILAHFPGLESLVLHTPVDALDPFPVNPGGRFLLAQMRFESAAALQKALNSPARARAREDFANFPPYEGTVSHQAMRAEKVL